MMICLHCTPPPAAFLKALSSVPDSLSCTPLLLVLLYPPFPWTTTSMQTTHYLSLSHSSLSNYCILACIAMHSTRGTLLLCRCGKLVLKGAMFVCCCSVTVNKWVMTCVSLHGVIIITCIALRNMQRITTISRCIEVGPTALALPI